MYIYVHAKQQPLPPGLFSVLLVACRGARIFEGRGGVLGSTGAMAI